MFRRGLFLASLVGALALVPRAPLAHTYTLYVVATDALGQRDSQKLRLTVRS